VRIVHQHRIKFWAPQGPVRLIVGEAEIGTPDPSDDQLTQAYQDFTLYNYLPPSMTPTQTEFQDWSRPRKRKEIVQAQLSKVGVVVSTQPTATVAGVTDPAQPVQVLLPINAPFRESLSDYCVNRLRTRIEANLGVGAR
jgi:hypothetical protein